MLGYIFALLPLYFLVYRPISDSIWGTPKRSIGQDAAELGLNSSFIAANEPFSCPVHQYQTHILYQEPLIIYIENFLSREESAHLLEIRYHSRAIRAPYFISNSIDTRD
jgi:prolyl 4-hydroxylase